MPTHHDETLLERYQREHRVYEEFRMKKHTTGKLNVVDNNWEVSSIYDESRQCIAVCHIYPGATEETQAEHEFRKEANARRLVACWNALEDLPQDALDGGWTRAGLEAYGVQMKAERDRLSAINAELLEASKRIDAELRSAWAARMLPHDAVSGDAVRQFSAAIAKAQGEQ